MSATRARQGGQVQLEQSNMRLALNMAKMSNGRFSRAAIEDTQQLINKPRAEVREEKKWGVECPCHNMVKAAIERDLAMVRENQTDGSLSCQNGTTKIQRHAGGPNAWVHLHLDGRHLSPNPHLCHVITMRAPKQMVRHPHMCIYILCFPTLDFCQGSHVR